MFYYKNQKAGHCSPDQAQDELGSVLRAVGSKRLGSSVVVSEEPQLWGKSGLVVTGEAAGVTGQERG